MRAPASTNANSLFIMSSSVKFRRARHCGCGLRPLAAERSTKENVPWAAPRSCCVGDSFLLCGKRLSGTAGPLATSVVATRWPVSKADASKATKGAALAATVLTIIKRTIDDVSMASDPHDRSFGPKSGTSCCLPPAPRP